MVVGSESMTILYYPNILTHETALQLINYIDSREWNTTLSRNTQQYGYVYDYKCRGLSASSALPMEGSIKYIRDNLFNMGIIDANQCIVNEYLNGQKIAPHVDAKVFGNVIVSISLLESCIIKFESCIDPSQNFEKLLECNSLLLISDEHRYNFKHSLSFKGNRRVSVTYRSV